MLKMIDKERLYIKFCEALPVNLELSESKRKEAFDFIYKICNIFIMEDEKDLYE